MRLTLLFMLLLSAVNVFSQQFPLNGYDVDTASQEWTAICGHNGSLLITTVDQPHPSYQLLGKPVGNLRLRFYDSHNMSASGPQLYATHIYKGNARVKDIMPVWNNEFIVSGGFADTLILGSDTLVNDDPFAVDPFVFKVNRQGQVIWFWTDHRPQNNFIHRLRFSEVDNYRLLAVGLANDVSGWVASFDRFTGALLWEETVTGARTISDAQIMHSANDTSLFITGSCESGASPFGLLAFPSYPITGYQNFLYRRDLSNQVGEIVKTVSHITFDFEPVITNHYVLRWITPYVNDTINNAAVQLVDVFNYNNLLNTYDVLSSTNLLHHGMFTSVVSNPLGFGVPSSEYFIYRPLISPISQLTIHDVWGTPNMYLNMGIHNYQDWIGSYGRGQFLWLAGIAGNQITYTTDFGGPSGTLSFPNINSSAPRWVLLSRSEYTSVPNTQRSLKFDVFPNPIQNSRFTIRLNEYSSSTTYWEIRDLQGKSLKQGETRQNEQEIDLTGLRSGVYLFELRADNRIGVKKVVLP